MDTHVTPADAPHANAARLMAQPPRHSRWLLWLAGGVLLGGVLLWWHPWAGGGQPAPKPPSQAVGVSPVTTGDMPLTVSALGTVTPLATVTVQTQISGQLTEVAFHEGQLVHRGDFLAQIDPRPYQVALAQAQGTLAKDQALLADARLDLKRYETLNRQDSIARQQLDTQQALVHQDEGTVVTDQAAVDAQKLNLTYCHIIAPVDGRVGLRLVDAGNYVQTSGSTGLVVITQLQPISVIFTVPEDAIPQIMHRLAGGATLTATALDRADSTQLATGALQTVDNQVDTTTGTVKIRAGFANTDNALFPNQFVNVNLLVDTVHNAVLAPNAAIQRGAPGTYVFLLNADNSVSVKNVKTGASDTTNTVITDGLAVGDKVITDGSDRLRDGAHVFVPGAQAPQGDAADPAKKAAWKGRHHKQDAE